MGIAHERGLKLERLVAELFKAKGYEVRHNVKIKGRSGVEHQIDVYAEYKAPLHTSRIVIECKSYDNPVDKDVVMKLIHEVEDLGMDKGILITTSYFTADAVSTAQGYNVELWDNLKLKELVGEPLVKEFTTPANVFHVEPLASSETALKAVDATLKGIFRRKGEIKEASIIFYPYYEVEVDARIYETKGLIAKKVEEKIVSANVLVDAITGSLCTYEDKIGISVAVPSFTLTEEETRAFQILSQQTLTLPALASLLSCSTAKARKIVQGLVAKGIVRVERHQQQIFYKLGISIPNPLMLKVLSNNLQIESREPESKTKIAPAVTVRVIADIIKLLWNGEIKNHKVVYYPYYACKITEGEKKYIKAVDMLTSKINERVSQILTARYSQLQF